MRGPHAVLNFPNEVSSSRSNSSSSSSSSSSSTTSSSSVRRSMGEQHGKQVIELEYLDDKLLEELLGYEEKSGT